MAATFTLKPITGAVHLFDLGDQTVYAIISDAALVMGTETATGFTSAAAAYTVEYVGAGLTYAGGAVTGGTISSFLIKDAEGDVLVTVTFSSPVKATDLQAAGTQFKATGNPAALDAVIMKTGIVWQPETDGDGYPNMSVRGSGKADIVIGGHGNDTFFGSAGADLLDGDDDDTGDTIDYSESKVGVTIKLGAGGAQTTGAGGNAAGDKIKNIEHIVGSQGNDTLTGNELENHIFGKDGNDTIEGGAGVDVLDGGKGTDTLSYASDTSGVTVDFLTWAVSGGHATGDLVTAYSFENLTGGSGNDKLTGGYEANVISGGDGDDIIDSGNYEVGSGDVLAGGKGTDTLLFTQASKGVTVDLSKTKAQATIGAGKITISGFENVTGTSFGDTLFGTSGVNIILAGGGDDLVEGKGGADTLDGGTGTSDTVSYASSGSGVTIDLALQDGVTHQTSGGDGKGDVLSGFENLTGSKGNDTLSGDSGDNIIVEGRGNDVLDGRGGKDLLSYKSAASGVVVDLSITSQQNTKGGGKDTIKNFENLEGSAFNDTLTGDAGDNQILGGGGNDLITGGLGADGFKGGDGIDTLSYATDSSGVAVNLAAGTISGTGQAFGDYFLSLDFENVVGSSFNDSIYGNASDNVIDAGDGDDVVGGLGGIDVFKGGNGIDTLDLSNATQGLVLDLGKTTAQSLPGGGKLTISGFEKLLGSVHDDVLTGTAADNTIFGNFGNDLIVGGGGADFLNGGDGIDTVSYASSKLGVTVDLTTTTQTSAGDANGDKLGDFENVIGSNKGDVITGTSADNTIEGMGGNDTLHGGGGADTASYASATAGVTVNLVAGTATGGAGSDALSGFEHVVGSKFKDTIIGDAGDNLITGGGGADTLTGGDGGDRFIFTGLSDKGDTITDFDGSMDRLLLGGSLAFGSDPKLEVGSTQTQFGPGIYFYDTDDGKLFFEDANGKQHLLVTLSGAPDLTVDNLVYI